MKKIKEILIILVLIYLATSQVLALYFWYLWAQDHGFWSTIFLGPLVGEFKGLLFPFFI